MDWLLLTVEFISNFVSNFYSNVFADNYSSRHETSIIQTSGPVNVTNIYGSSGQVTANNSSSEDTGGWIILTFVALVIIITVIIPASLTAVCTIFVQWKNIFEIIGVVSAFLFMIVSTVIAFVLRPEVKNKEDRSIVVITMVYLVIMSLLIYGLLWLIKNPVNAPALQITEEVLSNFSFRQSNVMLLLKEVYKEYSVNIKYLLGQFMGVMFMLCSIITLTVIIIKLGTTPSESEYSFSNRWYWVPPILLITAYLPLWLFRLF